MTISGRVESLDGSHTYVHPVTGEIFPAVGSIIGSTNDKIWKPAWSAKLGAIWTVDHLDLVNLTVKEAGPAAAVDLIKGAAARKRSFKANVGSFCHSVIETLILGGGAMPIIPEELYGEDYDGEPLTEALVDSIVDGFLNFNEDFDVDFEFSEVTVCNRRKRYAGTLDMGAVLDLGLMGALRLVIDAKTGAIQDWTWRVQQAAYADPDNEMWLPNGNIIPIPTYEGAAVLHLRRDYDRGYKLRIFTNDELVEGRAIFDRMHAVYNDQQANKDKPGRVIYPPLPDGSQPPPLIEDVDGFDGFGRCRKALLEAGHRSLPELAALTVVQARQIHGVGPKAMTAIQTVLRAYGMDFATERAAS